MEVLLLSPTLKDTIWGGTRLMTEFGFETKEDNIAEAWLLSCHKDGPSLVQNGVYAGKTLAEAVMLEGEAVLGTHHTPGSGFPILIKLIDAKDKLSVQVHPGDAYARRVENENGKTEAWLILDATPGAELVYGLSKKVSRRQFSESIRKKEIETILNYVPVKKGDVVFIPSGMLHAIGAGILLAEVQQSSNTTYRVYDYDRPGKDGKPRELHVEKATDVVSLTVPQADFSPAGKPERLPGAQKTYLTGCAYFSMTDVCVQSVYETAADETSFVSLLVLEGGGTLCCGEERLSLKKGDSVFIPAGKGAFELRGEMNLLETRI
jgi:mannose-6-phosphate isomerase